MTNPVAVDYSMLDRPEVLQFIFHPRPGWGAADGRRQALTQLIPVDAAVSVGACFHMTRMDAPTILFFHGNGEIVADYDDLGPIYNAQGLNFIPVDYRGYGASSGHPTVSAMMSDCHVIFTFVKNWLSENGYTGPVLIMGRSLGSAPALELAASCPDEIDGLVIESGFAYAKPLLALLGIPVDRLGFDDATGFRQREKIRTVTRPTLIIHAEYDHIIPFSDGQALYEASGAEDKRLLKIPGANHNDIFARALTDYMAGIVALVRKL